MITKGMFIGCLGIMILIGLIVITLLTCYTHDLYDEEEANMPKFDKSLVKVELIFNKESPMWYESPDNCDTAWLYNDEYVCNMMEYVKLNIKTSQYLYVRTIAERFGIDPLQFKADLGWEKGIYDTFEYKTSADEEKQEIRITFMAAHLV